MVFSLEHDTFLLEAYFRSGERNQNGHWDYSMRSCYQQFQEQFPDIAGIDYEMFSQHVRRVVARYRNTGSVSKGKSPGRPKVVTQEVLEDIRNRLEVSPTKPLRRLSAQTSK